MSVDSSSRRRFLAAASLGATALAPSAAAKTQPGPAKLPTVRFRDKEVTRLIIGTNPFFGYSHFNGVLDRAMREWMTPERRVETLLRAEAGGINTWQLHYSTETIADLKSMRAQGGKLSWFLLGHGGFLKDYPLIRETAKMGPIGIAHHGNVTDDHFRANTMNVVREFCKVVRDTGVMVGVSTHNPEVVEYIEDKNWDIDYYMTCLYRVSRTREEARALMGGEAPLGETFLEKDPERMFKVIRCTERPCLAFKVLGAGRTGYTRESIESSFRNALTNIKPSDAIIVGMFPKFKDEITENVELVQGILAKKTTSD